MNFSMATMFSAFQYFTQVSPLWIRILKIREVNKLKFTELIEDRTGV